MSSTEQTSGQSGEQTGGQTGGGRDEPGVGVEEGLVQGEEMEGAADGDGPVSDPRLDGSGDDRGDEGDGAS